MFKILICETDTEFLLLSRRNTLTKSDSHVSFIKHEIHVELLMSDGIFSEINLMRGDSHERTEFLASCFHFKSFFAGWESYK